MCQVHLTNLILVTILQSFHFPDEETEGFANCQGHKQQQSQGLDPGSVNAETLARSLPLGGLSWALIAAGAPSPWVWCAGLE